MIEHIVVRSAIEDACLDLYKRGKHLIAEKAHERTTTGSLNWGLARTSAISWGQTRWRVFSQKSLKAQITWVLVWRATCLCDLRWMQYRDIF